MRVFSPQTFKRCAQFFFVSAISIFACCQSSAELVKAPDQSKTESRLEHTPKDLNFAEKQYLNNLNPIDYREKYSISCLIYTYYRSFFEVKITIFSTYKINKCDPTAFIKTNSSSVKAQLLSILKSDFVILAGPHAQMMDFNNTPVENSYIAIGSQNYTPMAKAQIGILDLLKNFREWKKWISDLEYYSLIDTVQDIDYAWFPGTTVYKIITDQNKVFVMTNFIIRDAISSSDDIERIAKDLGQILNLPKGWRFESTKLDKILLIKQRQYQKIPTTHLQDEFGNLYIQITGE